MIFSVDTNGVGLNSRHLHGKVMALGYSGKISGDIDINDMGTKLDIGVQYGQEMENVNILFFNYLLFNVAKESNYAWIDYVL